MQCMCPSESGRSHPHTGVSFSAAHGNGVNGWAYRRLSLCDGNKKGRANHVAGDAHSWACFVMVCWCKLRLASNH